jgi:hypothetical protein
MKNATRKNFKPSCPSKTPLVAKVEKEEADVSGMRLVEDSGSNRLPLASRITDSRLQ